MAVPTPLRVGGAVFALLLTGASCEAPDEPAPECEEQPHFSTCSTAGIEDGVCLDSVCVARTLCPSGSCSELGPLFPIPDTNLRVCHGSSIDSSSGRIDCPGFVDEADCGEADYCGQDAQYGWDSENEADDRFSVDGTSERVVVDRLTQLEWQSCSAGQSDSDCSGEGTLQSWHEAVSYCDDLDWGEHDDWRLPDSYETHSIIDFSTTSPALDSAAFPNAPSLFAQEYDQWWVDCVWTSSIYAGDSSVSLVMMLNSGDISAGSGTEYHPNDQAAEGWAGCSARCVRGGQPPPIYERFLVSEPVSGEPRVVDTRGQRIWQGCSAGQSGSECDGDATMMDWKSALSYCQELDWAGSQDWRLPDIKELFGIVDLGTRFPAIDSEAFPNTPFYGQGFLDQNAGHYWSSTSRDYNDFALYANFSFGGTHFYVQSEGRHVRCVR